MSKFLNIIALSCLLVTVFPHSSIAYDQGGWGGHGYGGGGYWHGGDIHHFHEYDMEVWHNGYWVNRFHDGRMGWWWVAGGQWYFYPAPVYPYPDPFLPPTVVVTPDAQYWYCANPQGYYPYVPQCYVQWQPVAGNAPQPDPAPVVTAPPPAASPVASQPSSATRDQDDHQLNVFVVELEQIQQNDSDAAYHLKNLKSRVAAFHQALLQRSYNAADIAEDVVKLERSITEKQTKWGM